MAKEGFGAPRMVALLRHQLVFLENQPAKGTLKRKQYLLVFLELNLQHILGFSSQLSANGWVHITIIYLKIVIIHIG